MLIQIELRDSNPQGKRIGGKVYSPFCRVIRQGGDSLRMDNLAAPLQKFYHAMTAALLQPDPDNPEVDKVDKGSFIIIQRNLKKFLVDNN